MLDVKEAVKKAKAYVADIFSDEGVTNLGLEGVEHDDSTGMWEITLGFSRKWDKSDDLTNSALLSITGRSLAPPRTYKVVRLSDSDGTVLAVVPRETKN